MAALFITNWYEQKEIFDLHNFAEPFLLIIMESKKKSSFAE